MQVSSYALIIITGMWFIEAVFSIEIDTTTVRAPFIYKLTEFRR